MPYLMLLAVLSACSPQPSQPAGLKDGEFIRSTTARSAGKYRVVLVMEVCRHHPGGRVSCETREFDNDSSEVTVTFGDVQ